VADSIALASLKMVNYWPIQAGTNVYTDLIGNVSLVPNGAISLVADRFGNQNSAFETTSDSWAQTPTSKYIFTGGDLSITMWFKLINYGPYESLFDFGNGVNGDSVCMFNDGTRFYYQAFNQNTNTELHLSSPFTVGMWTHLAVTSNAGANTTIYINGVVKASGPTQPLRNVTRAGYFGKDDWGNFVDVLYDEIKMYAKALSGAEVAKDYANNQSVFTYL
jgi:hypothetical protein